MIVLLDTHALLWALGDPDRLGAQARTIIGDPHHELRVSAATAWEIATKHRIGRFPEAEVVLTHYHRHLTRLGAQAVDVTSDHALLAGRLPWPHRDPFDRMLAAQAITESWVLLTRDAAFGEVPGLRTLW